jgi:hypothetical protein
MLLGAQARHSANPDDDQSAMNDHDSCSKTHHHLELGKVGQAKTSYRVPANLHAEAVNPAARVQPGCDVIECRHSCAVEPWVEESKRQLAGSKEIVVDKADNGCKDRRGAGHAVRFCMLCIASFVFVSSC